MSLTDEKLEGIMLSRIEGEWLSRCPGLGSHVLACMKSAIEADHESRKEQEKEPE